MGVYKNGVWKTKELMDYFLNFIHDPVFIIEPDGSLWLQVFHHNNPSAGRFASTDTFTSGCYKDANKWFNCNLFNCFNKWEILFTQSLTAGATPQKFRWVQKVNPMTAAFADTVRANVTFTTLPGYTTPGSAYGGMHKLNSSSYLVCNNNAASNWFGAVGAWTAYNNGIPGYNGATVTTGVVDVYIRVDNNSLITETKTKIKDTQEIVSHDFIEI